MPWVPQNFIAKVSLITASWLNSIDQFWGQCFGGNTTQAAAQTAFLGTNQSNAQNALFTGTPLPSLLGGTGSTGVGAAFQTFIGTFFPFIFSLINPRTADEIAAGVVPTNFAYFATHVGYDARRVGTVGDGVTDNHAALQAAANVCAVSGSQLYLAPGVYAVASNTTLNCQVVFDGGAILKPATGVTVTIGGSVMGTPSQHFNVSASNAVVTGIKNTVFLPIWWGADPTGVSTTANDLAFQAMVNAMGNNGTTGGGSAYAPAGIYKFTTGFVLNLNAQTGLTIYGDGFIPGTNTFALQGGTCFHWVGATTGSPALISVTGSGAPNQAGNVRITGIGFVNDSAAGTPQSGPIGIFFSQGRWHKVRDCYFTGFDVGIKASNTFMCKYEGILAMAQQYAGFWGDFGGEDNHFDNCFFRYNTAGTSYGCFLQVSQNCVFNNCDFSNNPIGLSLFTSSNGSISSAVVNGGIFENCSTAAIQMNDSGSSADHYPRLMMYGGRIFNSGSGTTGIAAVVWACIEVVGVQCNYTNFIDTTGGAGNYGPIIVRDCIFTGGGSFIIGGLTVRRITDRNYNSQVLISSFTNSWIAGTPAPFYYVDSNNIVHLGGRITSGVIASPAFQLPAGFRPAGNTGFAVDSNNAFGRVGIDNTGSTNPTAGSNTYVALDGISFPVAN